MPDVMTADQLQQIRNWVETYMEGFRAAPGNLPAPIALKLDHTRHVAENAREIARELGWVPEDVHAAEALGWLHDVGRFAQFAEFGHFHDATSVDHGLRSCEIVQAAGLLAMLPADERDGLLESVRHHNAKSIPPTISPAGLPFLKLLRDADKLDIYRVVIEGLKRDGFRELADLWPHIDLDGPVHPRLLREIHTRRDADVVHVLSLADFLLLQAFWIYDLHYEPTRDRIRRRRILETIGSYLPDQPAIREILGHLRTYLQTGAPRESPPNAQPLCTGHEG